MAGLSLHQAGFYSWVSAAVIFLAVIFFGDFKIQSSAFCQKPIGENISLNTYFRCGEHGPSPTPREATGVEDLVEKLMRVRTENCMKMIYKKNCAKVMRDELNASKIVR